MVLLAAVAIAVAVVPMLLAYLQLGYHPALHGPAPDHAVVAEQTLERALVNASSGVPATHSWTDRATAVSAVRDRLGPTLRSLNRSALGRGTALQVSFNDTLATQVANTSCPGGRGRAFGPCEADRGVVVQERVGRTHVVAAGFDVLVVTPDGETRLRTVVERW